MGVFDQFQTSDAIIRVPAGHFKGQKMADLPDDFLAKLMDGDHWLYRSFPWLRAHVEAEWKRRAPKKVS